MFTNCQLESPPPRLFALIIGINKYKSPDIPNLVGAVDDANAMRNYLQKYLGVPSSRIRDLRDSEATRAAILKEVEGFSSNSKIKEGDPILMYYAGHGGSANTPEGWPGWEVGNTGKIELLIPYDHSSPLNGNHQHGIPDRTLGALLSHIAGKKGDNIVRQNLPCCRSPSTNYVTDCHPRLLSFRFWHTKSSESGPHPQGSRHRCRKCSF